ncbi:hypothetical protein CAEBREN_30185 [Caenorhabditis brenneri]|uniref:Uncharacterized protein n=1 Tax=Caenorhabditis brenneri TaxID=135651 RepID=G0NU46_CAEBE|nr:hypothetical protein CAEBREN_30185 [Caenorhabditis brenneri]
MNKRKRYVRKRRNTKKAERECNILGTRKTAAPCVFLLVQVIDPHQTASMCHQLFSLLYFLVQFVQYLQQCQCPQPFEHTM